MKYKIGDKIQIKSWNELIFEIENGFKFRSNMYTTDINHYYDKYKHIFCIGKREIDLISSVDQKISSIDYNQYIFKIEKRKNYKLPIEFIKENKEFKLPDELFKI